MERIGLELMIYSSIILLLMLIVSIFEMNGVIVIILFALVLFIIGSKLTEKEEYKK